MTALRPTTGTLIETIAAAIEASTYRHLVHLDPTQLASLARGIARRIRPMVESSRAVPVRVVATVNNQREVLVYGNVPMDARVVVWSEDAALDQGGRRIVLADGTVRWAFVGDGDALVDLPLIEQVFGLELSDGDIDGTTQVAHLLADPLASIPAAVVSSIG